MRSISFLAFVAVLLQVGAWAQAAPKGALIDSGKRVVLPKACSSGISKLRRQADDARLLADDSKERAVSRKMALTYYHCAQSVRRKPGAQHSFQKMLLQYSESLYASLVPPLDAAATTQLTSTLAPLVKSKFSDVRSGASKLLAIVQASVPTPTPDPSIACEKAGLKEALIQWESDFKAYANLADASSRAENEAVQQSRSSTYVPSTLNPGLQNALYNVLATQQSNDNQRAAANVRQAFSRERQALGTLETDEQAALAAGQLIQGSGASQTAQIAQRLTSDVEAITQYSSSYTSEGHAGQAGVDDLNHIKASKLDYDDAARQLVQLPYCSK